MRIDTAQAQRNVVALQQAIPKALASPMTRAVSRTARALTLDIRSQISAAGLGNKLANTVRNVTYPRGRDSIGAAGYVWSKAPELIDVFDQGAVIRSKTGGWVAIPTPETARIRGYRAVEWDASAGRIRGVGRKTARITPKSFQAATGMKLRMVYLPGKPRALLVAEGVQSSRAKLGFRRPGKTGRNAASFVAFILVPQVTLRKRLDIASLARRYQPVFRAAVAEAIRSGVRAASRAA